MRLNSSLLSGAFVGEPLRQVLPMRVVAIDEPQFLLAPPAFDFFLARDCRANVAKHFMVHQPEDAVTLRKSRHRAVAVLFQPAFEIVRYADVEIARAAGEDVDAVGAVHARRRIKQLSQSDSEKIGTQ